MFNCCENFLRSITCVGLAGEGGGYRSRSPKKNRHWASQEFFRPRRSHVETIVKISSNISLVFIVRVVQLDVFGHFSCDDLLWSKQRNPSFPGVGTPSGRGGSRPISGGASLEGATERKHDKLRPRVIVFVKRRSSLNLVTVSVWSKQIRTN